MEIVVSGRDAKLIRLIEKLAVELGLNTRVVKGAKEEELRSKERSERLYRLMENMAASGGIKSVKDPVAWQREVREDKKLYGRE